MIQTLEQTVKPGKFEKFPFSVQGYFEQLDAFQAPYLEEKLLMEEKFASREEYQEAFTEFKKYVALSKLYDTPVAMMSKTVDEVWHQFILFTREYHAFSTQFYGTYFHHAPYLPSRPGNPEHEKNFVRLYTKNYGTLPAIWRGTQP